MLGSWVRAPNGSQTIEILLPQLSWQSTTLLMLGSRVRAPGGAQNEAVSDRLFLYLMLQCLKFGSPAKVCEITCKIGFSDLERKLLSTQPLIIRSKSLICVLRGNKRIPLSTAKGLAVRQDAVLCARRFKKQQYLHRLNSRMSYVSILSAQSPRHKSHGVSPVAQALWITGFKSLASLKLE